MLKALTAFLLLISAAAQAAPVCDLTDIGGPGASIVEEGSNPVVSGTWAYSAYATGGKVVVLAAAARGAKQKPLQTIFDKPGRSTNIRLAATGKSLYVIWLQGGGVAHLWFAANSNHGNPKAWSKPIDLGVALHLLEQISADGNSVHIAYILDNHDTAAITSTDNGKTFAAPLDLGPGNGEAVIASMGQDVYAAWEFSKDSRPTVEFAYSNDGGKTFSSSNISDNGVRHAREPILNLNRSSGRLSLVWREDSPLQGVYLQSTDHGHSWSAPVSIDQPARQFMVQDTNVAIFASYLKEYMIDGVPDWQVQLAVSRDGGKTFPSIRNLSGPTGVSKIVGDNARPMPFASGGQIRVTGVSADGARIWSGDRAQIDPSSQAYLGPGELASPAGQVALWQAPEGMVTYAYCHD